MYLYLFVDSKYCVKKVNILNVSLILPEEKTKKKWKQGFPHPFS